LRKLSHLEKIWRCIKCGKISRDKKENEAIETSVLNLTKTVSPGHWVLVIYEIEWAQRRYFPTVETRNSVGWTAIGLAGILDIVMGG